MRDSQVPMWKTAHAILLEKRPGGENRCLLTHRCLDPSSRSRARHSPWRGQLVRGVAGKHHDAGEGRESRLMSPPALVQPQGHSWGIQRPFLQLPLAPAWSQGFPPSTCAGWGRGRAPCPGGGPGLSRASSLPPPGVTGPSPSFQRHLKV